MKKDYVEKKNVLDLLYYQLKNIIAKLGSNTFWGFVIGIALIYIFIKGEWQGKDLSNIIFYGGFLLIVATLKLEDILEIIKKKDIK